MSTFTYTSSERATERVGTEYPPCCGQPPIVLTWRKKGLIAIACVSSTCPNHEGVLCYPEEAMKRWEHFRKVRPV